MSERLGNDRCRFFPRASDVPHRAPHRSRYPTDRQRRPRRLAGIGPTIASTRSTHYEEIGMYLQVLRTSLVALAVTAFGSDAVSAAVVSIDQKAAEAGKVTAGDTPGFPVTISQP